MKDEFAERHEFQMDVRAIAEGLDEIAGLLEDFAAKAAETGCMSSDARTILTLCRALDIDLDEEQTESLKKSAR